MLRVFNVKRGDTFCFTITFKNLTEDLDTFVFGLKTDYNDVDYIIEKSLGDGIEKISAGKYRVTFSAEESADLEPNQYIYDLRFTLDDIVNTPLSGYLIIEETVFNG
jgi:hypothetical protein